MPLITKKLFSDIILPFLEHPKDDSALRTTCRQLRDVFPLTVNLYMKNAVTLSSLTFLIKKYKDHHSSLYSIKATLIHENPIPAEYADRSDWPRFASLQKISLNIDHWSSVAQIFSHCRPPCVKELHLKGSINWFFLAGHTAYFTNLHTLTLLQTDDLSLDIANVDAAYGPGKFRNLPLQKCRIDAPYLNLEDFSVLTELPQIEELILDHVSPELFTSAVFRAKAQEMDALKEINGHPDTQWRPLLATATDAELTERLRPPHNALPPVPHQDTHEAAPSSEAAPSRACAWFFAFCEYIRAFIRCICRCVQD